MEPLFELPLRLPKKGSRELMRALHRQLRSAIVDGRLKPGLRLSATRSLAARLGVARNTVIAAYELLLVEGYVTSRPGGGTYVANNLPTRPRPTKAIDQSELDRRLAPFWRGSPKLDLIQNPPCRFDFRFGLPDHALFPFRTWRRLAARSLLVLAKQPPTYAELAGRQALRDAIAKHVSATRAVSCDAEDIIITAGARQAFDLVARTLVIPGRTVVAVEDPAWSPIRTAFAAAGATPAPVPVDAEGLVVERIPPAARIIWVTPSHQFPIGVTMSSTRRLALLDFARKHNAIIVEDDYDSEFRFDGRPLDALQTLDRTGVVFYVGSFSKCLLPTHRLGFLVAPAWARSALVTARLIAGGTPYLEQDTLAAFIADGYLARHIRKLRKVYAERRDALLQAIERYCGQELDPIRPAAGLHLSATLATPIKARDVVARAAEAGIGIESLSRFALVPSAVNGLVFGYGQIAAPRISEAIRQLAQVIKKLKFTRGQS